MVRHLLNQAGPASRHVAPTLDWLIRLAEVSVACLCWACTRLVTRCRACVGAQVLRGQLQVVIL